MFSGGSVLSIGFGSLTASLGITGIGFTGGATSSIISVFGCSIT